jgi:acetyl-CoA carboxylase biotin carboxyl carrier protein
MKLTEIQDLIKFVARAGVTEVEIEQKDFKLTIKSEMPKGRGKKEEQVVQTIQVPAAMPQTLVQAAPVTAAPVPAAAPAAAPAPAGRRCW